MRGGFAAGASAPPVAGRTDWFALLPFEGPAKVVVLLGDATADELALIARHFGVESVTQRLPARDVDVLIVRDVSQARAAVGALAPAGVAWIEEPTRWSRLTRTAARAAKANGRRVHADYWVLPKARHARRYVPAGHRAALRWYLGELFVAQTAIQRIARRMTMLLPGLATLAIGDRAMVVVGPSAQSGLLAAGPGTGVPADQSVIMQSGGHDLGNRTIVLPFGARGGPTGSVIKVASAPEMSDLVDAEFRILQELHAALPDEIAVGIPVPEAQWVWARRAVTEESMISGPTVDHAIGSGRIDPLVALREVADWVGRFHAATAIADTWTADRFDRTVRPTLDAYRLAYGADELVERLFRRVEARSRELSGCPLPEVRRHWDLTPSNVILSDRGIAVIDWEPGVGRSLDGRGLPLCDLDYFVKFWLHLVHRPETRAEEDALFPHKSSSHAIAGRRVIGHYCGALGIDLRFAPMIAAYQWSEQAVHDHARSQRLGGMPEARQAATRHLVALASDQEALFVAYSSGVAGPSVGDGDGDPS